MITDYGKKVKALCKEYNCSTAEAAVTVKAFSDVGDFSRETTRIRNMSVERFMLYCKEFVEVK